MAAACRSGFILFLIVGVDNFVLADSFFLLQEWGDPRNEEFYFYMKSYSPVDNVSTRQLYVVPL